MNIGDKMVRKAETKDLGELVRIYESAREFMHTNGNPNQWAGAYPDRETLERDIEIGQLYVVEENGEIYGCFALIFGVDPTYVTIYDGSWKSDTPYAAIHRIASDRTRKGVFSRCLEYARERYNHLRVDTHKDNIPMQNAALKNGFEYRGVIHLANGDPRLAYEWTGE